MDTDFAAESTRGSIAVAAGVDRAGVYGLILPGVSSAAVGPQSGAAKNCASAKAGKSNLARATRLEIPVWKFSRID